jgi:integrase
MPTRLTAKFCAAVRKQGQYLDHGGPVQGLIFVVGSNGTSKSWLLRYRFHGKRREMGLGSYPEISLAAGREKGGEARRLLARDIDPIEQRKGKRREQWLAEAKDLTFLQVAEKLLAAKTEGDHPWWGKKQEHKNRCILDNKFKSLHNLPINSEDAAEALTLRLHKIIGPMWLKKPPMARDIKYFAKQIGAHAHALKVLPISVNNPAGGPLDILLTARQRKGGKQAAIPYQQVPELYAKLEELSQPKCDYFTIRELSIITGIHQVKINRFVLDGKLRATKGERLFQNMSMPYEWRITPADAEEFLARYGKTLNNATPGLRPVGMLLVKFALLNGVRSSEAREMRWSEYDPLEKLWILPWHRTKEGDDIRQDHVIPLSQPSIDTLDLIERIQKSQNLQTEYVFGNYRSRWCRSGKLGHPVSPATMLNSMRYGLSKADQKATVHGNVRTTFRSWGEEQNGPDGKPRFADKDLERAIGHAIGFGPNETARIYTRQSRRIAALIPIFDGWAKFITSGGAPADVIPFRKRAQGD